MRPSSAPVDGHGAGLCPPQDAARDRRGPDPVGPTHHDRRGSHRRDVRRRCQLLDPRRLDQARRMKLRRSRLTCRDVNRQSPRLCEPLCNSGPVSGSAGNKERLLLRAAPKGNPRSTLLALPLRWKPPRRSTAAGLGGYPSSGGTGSSNPLSSSGESIANLTWSIRVNAIEPGGSRLPLRATHPKSRSGRKLIAEASPQAGEHVVHIGAGTGYYTASMAHLVGPSGKATGIELDPGLAERARDNLSSYPDVDVVCGNGAVVPF